MCEIEFGNLFIKGGLAKVSFGNLQVVGNSAEAP